MNPYTNAFCATLSIGLPAAILFGLLCHHPAGPDTGQALLIAVTASLGLHAGRLCSRLSLGPREPDGR